jgi:DNA-binding MarR family transcriptional regulator
VLDDTLLERLVRLSFLVQQRLTEVAQRHGLTLQQLRLLAVLSDREPTMAQLAALMGLERSSLSGLVDRAARTGLVVRAAAGHDRRSVRVRLTADGRSRHATLHGEAAASVGELTAGLRAAERDRLVALLGPVVCPPPRADASSAGMP